jgi:hypothetical protein
MIEGSKSLDPDPDYLGGPKTNGSASAALIGSIAVVTLPSLLSSVMLL